jgi:hypothetical protein
MVSSTNIEFYSCLHIFGYNLYTPSTNFYIEKTSILRQQENFLELFDKFLISTRNNKQVQFSSRPIVVCVQLSRVQVAATSFRASSFRHPIDVTPLLSPHIFKSKRDNFLIIFLIIF